MLACPRLYFWVDVDVALGVRLTHLDSVSRNQQCLLELDAAPAEQLGDQGGDPASDLIELYTLGSDASRRRPEWAACSRCRLGMCRIAFSSGQPIGRFQAVQHRCADMAVAYSGAQSLLYKAAWLLSTGKPAEETLLMCHAYGRDAAAIVLGQAHQVHGAMGFMIEYPLHQFSRRAKVYELSLAARPPAIASGSPGWSGRS